MERDFSWWWEAEGEWVEPPNERRNGWSGMVRVMHDGRMYYVKRQRNHLCRTLRHPFGWPTTSREWHYLHRLRQLGIGTPVPVFHDARSTAQGTEAVLVTEELNGYRDLSQFATASSEMRRRIAVKLGAMLARLHGARLQHSSLYDKHVMIREDDEDMHLALIDLEKMRVRLTRRGAAEHDLEQLKRRQNVFDVDDWSALQAAHAELFSAS